MDENLSECKRFSPKRLLKEYSNKREKTVKQDNLTSVCKSYKQPVQQNALHEAVGSFCVAFR